MIGLGYSRCCRFATTWFIEAPPCGTETWPKTWDEATPYTSKNCHKPQRA
jgi:hypothetical protein